MRFCGLYSAVVVLVVGATAAGDIVYNAPAHGRSGAGAVSARELSRTSPGYVDWLLGGPSCSAAVRERERPPAPEPPVGPMFAAPAPPSSLTLVLSAAASLGALQGVRSIKRLPVAALPDWYHTGAPPQLGPATPFDLEWRPLSLCVFDPPVPGPVSRIDLPAPRPRLRSEAPSPVQAPRAPPARA